MLAPFTAGWQSADLHPLIIEKSEVNFLVVSLNWPNIVSVKIEVAQVYNHCMCFLIFKAYFFEVK